MSRGTDYRINGGYMKRRFALVCEAMGWDCKSPAWQGEGEARHTTVGYTFIEKGPYQPPLYRVVQFSGNSGAERQLSSNMRPREMAAWFEGVLKAHETLVKLHSDMILSVDSLRGNEKFAAQAIRNSL